MIARGIYESINSDINRFVSFYKNSNGNEFVWDFYRLTLRALKSLWRRFYR